MYAGSPKLLQSDARAGKKKADTASYRVAALGNRVGFRVSYC